LKSGLFLPIVHVEKPSIIKKIKNLERFSSFAKKGINAKKLIGED
jgi:hypothetical protein